MPNHEYKVKWTPDLIRAQEKRVLPVVVKLQEENRHMEAAAMLSAMLLLVEWPEDIQAELAVAASISTQKAIIANAQVTANVMAAAGYTKEDLQALDARYQQVVKGAGDATIN